MHSYMYNACTFFTSVINSICIFVHKLNGLGIFIPLDFDFFMKNL